MQSFLIVSRNSKRAREQVKAICDKFSIDTFDRTVITRQETLKAEKTKKLPKYIGIDEVKSVQKKIFFKPLRGKMKAIIFQEAELLTPEAQNALLKVLEEPPIHTLLLLITAHFDAILPTVRSRCYTIRLPDDREKENTPLIDELLSQPIDTARSLELALLFEQEKEKLPTLLEACILTAHDKLLTIQSPTELKKNAVILRKLQDAYRIITTTNANTRLTLEATFLSFATT